MAFTLAPLPYAHDALEPHFDTQTMQIHHGKHHQAYVDNLNKAIAGTEHENKSLEELQQLEDVGPKVATAIYDFFQNKENIELLQQLEALGVVLKNEHKEIHSSGNLNGLTFLFTGTLPTLKRSDAEQMVEVNGGSILSGVSAKLNYLVVGADSGSKLEKAKKLNTVKIITEEEFLNMLKN